MAEHQPKIMVVDDNPGLRLTLEGILEDEGFDVVGAEDGYKAIELAKEFAFDLIFMDVKMPGINGVEAFKEIKRVSQTSIVVMITGFAVEDLIKEALDEGAYAVVYKPFDVAKIIDIVNKVLRTTLVLVVDDKATDREILRAILEDHDYQVQEASDGPEAIAMAAERRYGLIIMDIKMPGMDGFTTLEKIRQFDPEAKALFISGYTMEEPVMESLRQGAYAALAKPIVPDALLELIRSVPSRQRDERPGKDTGGRR